LYDIPEKFIVHARVLVNNDIAQSFDAAPGNEVVGIL
jgi:hypothetical protein